MRPIGQSSTAERAVVVASFRFVILVLSAGLELQRDPRTDRGQRLRHRLMRHYRRRKVGAAIAIACLPRRLQHSAAMLDAIGGASAPQRFAALLGNAASAKAAPSITSTAKPKLNAAPTANDDSKALRRHRPRTADYWTWISGRDEGAILRRTGDPESSRVAAPELSLILAVRLPSLPAPIRPSYVPVNGEPPRSPSGALHRLCAHRGARSQLGLAIELAGQGGPGTFPHGQQLADRHEGR
jgi:hypothetical protein